MSRAITPAAFRNGLRWRRRRLAAARAVVSWALALRAAALLAQTAPGDEPVITSPQQYWNLSADQKQRLQPLRIELVVTYYDPYWNLLWGDWNGTGSYIPVRGEPLPLKAGQKVRIEGLVDPSAGLERDRVTVTVLADNALPAPIEVTGDGIEQWQGLDGRRVALTGYVCRQNETDTTHVQYEVLSGNRLVTVWLLVGAGEQLPQLVNNLVRLEGVYVSSRDTSGKLRHVEFWLAHRGGVQMLGRLGTDRRFGLPRLPIERLPATAEGEWVRLTGRVSEFRPGEELTLSDETGAVTIVTPQPGSLRPGDRLEVVGRAAGRGIERTLTEPLFRLEPVGGPARELAEAQPAWHLRLVRQIMELPPGEVAHGYPVTLRGVVSWSDERERFFFLQDATGGVRVQVDSAVAVPATGTAVLVRGATLLGGYAPEVRLAELQSQGTTVLPSPRTTTLEQLLTGAEEARLVEIRGYLRRVVPDGQWARLDLTTATGELSVYAAHHEGLPPLAGAVVRVTGVCAAEANSQRELTGVRLWTGGVTNVVAEEAPAVPFAAPRLTIAALKRFTGVAAFSNPVVVTGTIVQRTPGRQLVVQDGEAGLLVYSRDTTSGEIGGRVEVAGFPGRDGRRIVLREARLRPAAAGPGGPEPLELTEPARLEESADARLVRLRANLSQAVVQGGEARLVLTAGGATFDAEVGVPAEWNPPDPGSLLEITGVYLIEFDESRQPHSFLLLADSAAAIRLIESPPWWTAGRALAVAAGFACVAAAVVVWVVMLRRRVRRQTEQIRAQLDREARMQTELERSSRLDSLGVLAGGIAHDFNNLLTAVMGNIGLIKFDAEAMERVGHYVSEAEKATKRATEVTQQLLTFAKGGNPVRKAVDLPGVVREAAGFALHGSNVRAEFDLPAGLPPADADASQISRVVHNLVLNAVQAMPGGGVVRLQLAETRLHHDEIPALPAGHYLRLAVTDNGPGIAADRLPRILDPYFSSKKSGNGLGLATARSIVRKHQGHIELESSPGRGSTFRIWLPVATEPLKQPETAAAPRRLARAARVLVMDDESVVRNLAREFLHRAGHEATLVEDGSAAVAAFSVAAKSGRAFDLVILDLTVPGGKGGQDAAADILKIDPRARLIASSGYSNDPVMSRHRDYGFAGVIPKPYDYDAFMRTVDEVGGRPA